MIFNPLSPSGAKPEKNGANEFSEAGGVHRVLLRLCAVFDVVGVEGGPETIVKLPGS